MVPPSRSPFLARGALAGGLVGLLSGIVYLLVFAGIDWTAGSLLEIARDEAVSAVPIVGGLIAAGVLVGLLVSRLTRSSKNS